MSSSDVSNMDSIFRRLLANVKLKRQRTQSVCCWFSLLETTCKIKGVAIQNISKSALRCILKCNIMELQRNFVFQPTTDVLTF